jgi:hypothetical protein
MLRGCVRGFRGATGSAAAFGDTRTTYPHSGKHVDSASTGGTPMRDDRQQKVSVSHLKRNAYL